MNILAIDIGRIGGWYDGNESETYEAKGYIDFYEYMDSLISKKNPSVVVCARPTLFGRATVAASQFGKIGILRLICERKKIKIYTAFQDSKARGATVGKVKKDKKAEMIMDWAKKIANPKSDHEADAIMFYEYYKNLKK